MGSKLLLSVFTVVCIVHGISATVLCYHGTWSRYRSGNGTFLVSSLDPTLCTHYIYAFVGLNATTNKVQSLDAWLDIGLKGFSDAVALKQRNPDLKVLVAIGGWNEGSEKYSVMASSAASRAVFIQSALELVETHGFDGFDLDWEYPADRNNLKNPDKVNFGLLLQEFSAVFKPKNLLLTAAVGAPPAKVDLSYDVPVLSQYLDFINIMLYDFHGAWDSTTGHNAPMFTSTRYAGTASSTFNLFDSVRYWIAKGADPAKLALGIPIYGRTFTLTNPSDTAPGAPQDGNGGPAGPYTLQAGFWGYNEIVEKFNQGGWTKTFDVEQGASYAYKDNVWLSYDDVYSVQLKVQFAKSLGLGAIMVWSVETDDFHGLSGTTFPILKAINSELETNCSTSTGTTSGTTVVISADSAPESKPSDTADSSVGSDASDGSSSNSDGSSSSNGGSSSSNGGSSSSSDGSSSSNGGSSSSNGGSSSSSNGSSSSGCTSAAGYFRDSSDCSKYYYCMKDGAVFHKFEFTCPYGLFYDLTTHTCNFQNAVQC